jgi:hypothetical protein
MVSRMMVMPQVVRPCAPVVEVNGQVTLAGMYRGI